MYIYIYILKWTCAVFNPLFLPVFRRKWDGQHSPPLLLSLGSGYGQHLPSLYLPICTCLCLYIYIQYTYIYIYIYAGPLALGVVRSE